MWPVNLHEENLIYSKLVISRENIPGILLVLHLEFECSILFRLFPFKMVGMVIGAGIAIVLIAILIFFILRRIQLRSK